VLADFPIHSSMASSLMAELFHTNLDCFLQIITPCASRGFSSPNSYPSTLGFWLNNQKNQKTRKKPKKHHQKNQKKTNNPKPKPRSRFKITTIHHDSLTRVQRPPHAP
jgi:hypothetical protein